MTKITHSALAQPERSWLRKMSLKTMIRIQIQMKNRKNQSIDQNTWPVPHSAATMDMGTLLGSGVGRRQVGNGPGRAAIVPRAAPVGG